MTTRLFFFLVFSTGLFSCSSDNSTEPQQQNENSPTVTLNAATSITETSASFTAEAISNGSSITARGLCWETSPNPTVDNNVSAQGSGEGVFEVTIEGLSAETTYYVRAYVTDSEGTYYSSGQSFETLEGCVGNIYQGDVQLSSQEEVDDFGALGYCEINGYLVIRDTGIGNAIIDLSPLNTIQSVKYLSVMECDGLQTLNGLDGIRKLDEGLIIYNNSVLVDLSALQYLSGDIGYLFIGQNDLLESLDGLEGITALTYDSGNWASLIIISNRELTNIDALSNINQATFGIDVSFNYDLQSISALSNITQIESGSLRIVENPFLESIDGLQSLTSVQGDLEIAYLPLILDLDVLSNLTNIGNSIRIYDNDHLLNFDSLQNVTNDGLFIQIQENHSLQSLLGLSGITKASTIWLSDFDGTIDSLSGLENLNEVTGDLILTGGNFSSLAELENLESVGRLRITYFENIQDLEGLSNLITVGKELEFRDNGLLTDYCGLNNLIFNGSFNGNFITMDNAYNPTYQDLLEGNCSQ